MYRLELDLDLYFVPPMEERGEGITLTRSIKLPFPPVSGLAICGRELDDPPYPDGLPLHDVVWDMDRQTFMARTSVQVGDLQIACIPDWIQSWVDRGWRLGSYADAYAEPETEGGDGTAPVEELSDADEKWYDTLHQLAPSRRPRWFNRFFKALVRHMADTMNNIEVAYAMDRTGRYFSDAEAEKPETAATAEWSEARREFVRMTLDQKVAWREAVERYPSLDDVLADSRSRSEPAR